MSKNSMQNMNDYSKPLLKDLLSVLKLDKVFHRASGDFMYYNNDPEIEVLDLVGGYGSLLLGHNNQELLNYRAQLCKSGIPVHAQLSVRSGTMKLSKLLSDTIGEKSNKKYICTITNSGTEAVEAALKHARLNFKNKLNSLNQSIELAFVEIENYFKKYELELEVFFENEVITDISTFKKAVYRKNKDAIKKNSPKVLSSIKSFHGKTLGALSVSSNSVYREPFIIDTNDTIFYNWNENEVENHIAQNEIKFFRPRINNKGDVYLQTIHLNSIVAIILEPILGEGGIHIVPHDFLKYLRSISLEFKIPLIFDEIQSGFYRTGEFLASFKAEVYADYYVIGKSLGGGISKISALIIERDKYIPAFDLLHTSTFAEDDISSLVAVKALEIAKRNKNFVFEKGEYLLNGLQQVKAKYDGIIEEVRGDGLMIGISFQDFEMNDCHVLQMLSRSNYLGYLLASYLLNEKGIRVSVALSDPSTIRVHPSLFITKNSMDKFIDSIDELAQILRYSDMYYLLRFMLDENEQELRPLTDFGQQEVVMENDYSIESHVGFIAHYLNPEHIRVEVPSLAVLRDETLIRLLQSFMSIAEPVLLGSNCVENINGKKIVIHFIGVPFTSGMVKNDLITSKNKIAAYRKLCNKAIEYFYEHNIATVGLGQFTSIIMHNGSAVSNSNVTVTTGNSFTVYNAINTIKNAIDKKQFSEYNIAVIGANGNIASAITDLLTNYCNKLFLIGNSNSSEKNLKLRGVKLLKKMFTQLLNTRLPSSPLEKRLSKSNLFQKIIKTPALLDSNNLWENYLNEFEDDTPINYSADLKVLKQCNIVVVATNEESPFLMPNHFKAGTFICDISVPTNCAIELIEDDLIDVVQGGVVNLPNEEKLCLKGLPLNKGQAFACMSETMLMGFENSGKTYSFGNLELSQILEIGELGNKNGFNEGKAKRKGQLMIE